MDYTAVIGSIISGNAAELGLIGGLVILALVVWTIVWKGLALWHAAKNGHKIWFIALLILNTVGILEIIYYFFFRKKGQKGQQIVEENFPAKEAEEEPKEAL
tara:strand:+ start:3745 stop:4050 length:306 start_codon:yes stop_codon:yes gene_type:complete